MTYNKQFLIYSILLFIFALVSCSENKPLEARYKAEKMFHEAENALKDARAFSPNLSVAKATEITKLFKSLVDFCYTQIAQTDSTLSPVEFNEFHYLTYQAATRLSQLYYLTNDYNKCVQINNRLIDRKSVV